jgi:hypothetical protein
MYETDGRVESGERERKERRAGVVERKWETEVRLGDGVREIG